MERRKLQPYTVRFTLKDAGNDKTYPRTSGTVAYNKRDAGNEIIRMHKGIEDNVVILSAEKFFK